jgi:putative resolvase
MINREGLGRLLDAILPGDVGRLVLTHKDRLLRFGAELVFPLCEAKGVEVVIINQGADMSFEEDLASSAARASGPVAPPVAGAVAQGEGFC